METENIRKYTKSQAELAEQASTYMLEHMDKKITISEISEMLHVSQTQLKNSFRNYYTTANRSTSTSGPEKCSWLPRCWQRGSFQSWRSPECMATRTAVSLPRLSGVSMEFPPAVTGSSAEYVISPRNYQIHHRSSI